MPAEYHVRPRARGARSFTFTTDLDRVLLGRGEVCDVRLPHPHVSFHHATVQRTPGGYELSDNGSTNGTWHAGRRVHPGEAVRLHSGDRIVVPGFLIDVRFAPGVAGDCAGEPDAVGRQIYLSLLRPDLQQQVPRLEVDAGPLAGRTLALAGRDAPYVVGRDPACDWEIPDREASREHLAVASDGTTVRVLDRGSKNGVRLNGRLVREAVLADGDALEVGRTVLVLRDPRGAVLRRLSRETTDAEPLVDAFADVEQGDEAKLSEAAVPATPPAPVPGPAPDEPSGREAADAPAAPPAAPPVPSPAPPAAAEAKDIGDLLAAPAPAPTSARCEGRPASVPDGTDALIVALGVIVFLVALIAIYLLLK
jgi:pSer/pThr/pTyr-binding forkhead associated (FHA) protein